MGISKELLAALNSDEKLNSSKAFRDRVYTDQPLIRTAAQLKRPETPEKIKEMKSIAFSQEAYWKTSSWLFVTQGKFMEDYTDDLEFSGDFTAYYPTYRDLTTEQLRGYFAWRTNVRNGSFPAAPTAYVLLYIYEIINCIGFSSPAEAFHQLRKLSETFSASCQDIRRLSSRWLIDMAVYYSLDSSLLDDTPDNEFDNSVITLMNWDTQDKENVTAAIMRLSAYDAEKSSFFIKYPELFTTAAYRAFISLAEYFENHRKNSLCDKMFGKLVEIKYRIFESAVFFDTQPDRSCTYKINDIHIYNCINGEWTCRKLHGNRGRNKLLGEIVRTVDSILREKTALAHRINCGELSRNTVSIIEKVIVKLLAERNRPKPVNIDIDFSMLDKIRSAAETTRVKLIVEEDSPSAIQDDEPLPLAENDNKTDSNAILSDPECAFLKELLYCGDPFKAAASNDSLPSILADSVNEKLFDDFNDTVIGFDNDIPYVIEDYTEELKEMFPK